MPSEREVAAKLAEADHNNGRSAESASKSASAQLFADAGSPAEYQLDSFGTVHCGAHFEAERLPAVCRSINDALQLSGLPGPVRLPANSDADATRVAHLLSLLLQVQHRRYPARLTEQEALSCGIGSQERNEGVEQSAEGAAVIKKVQFDLNVARNTQVRHIMWHITLPSQLSVCSPTRVLARAAGTAAGALAEARGRMQKAGAEA